MALSVSGRAGASITPSVGDVKTPTAPTLWQGLHRAFPGVADPANRRGRTGPSSTESPGSRSAENHADDKDTSDCAGSP